LTAAWLEIQRADAALANPFFHPEFTRAVGAVRQDVEVAVLSDGGNIVGFFPFQRGPREAGRPVGGVLSDYHGVVHGPDAAIDPKTLLRGCRLRAWRFNHLIASQAAFAPHHVATATSPYVDLGDGFEAYCIGRRQSGSRTVERLLRFERKIQREVGPLRFVAHQVDDELLDTLFRWRVAQYERIGAVNFLATDWSASLVRRIAQTDATDFGGMLSALYVDDRLVAVHLGMRSGAVVHGWYSGYDDALRKYSPGMLLLLNLFRQAGDIGVRRFDFGKGPEQYKQSLKTGEIALAEGVVDLRPLSSMARNNWIRLRERVRGSRLRAPAQTALRWLRRRTFKVE